MKKKFLLGYILLGSLILAFAISLCSLPAITILPITINESNKHPAIAIVLEGKRYDMEFDSGALFQLSLQKLIFDTLGGKKSKEVHAWCDIKGNSYKSSSFVLPKLKLANHVITDLQVTDIDENYFPNICIGGNGSARKIPDGILGLGAFGGNNLLFDFIHSTLIVCNDKKLLKTQGYHLHSMHKVPFEFFEKRVIIVIQTELGPLRLMVDSGASASLIKSCILESKEYSKSRWDLPQWTTSTFVMNGKDFGPQDFILWNFPKEFEGIDGVIGMDFLLEHQLYIDQQNKVLYIA